MERMLVVVFDSEEKAQEGQSALRELELEGSIAIYAGTLVIKHADGNVSFKPIDDFGVGTLAGTAVGSLIGLLGGPIRAGRRCPVGTHTRRALRPRYCARRRGFVDDVLEALTPNKVAVAAEIEEDWTRLTAEMSRAQADRKAKLQKKIEQLAGKIDAQDKKLTERLGAFEACQKAKKAILHKNAAAGRALKNLANTQI